MIYCFIKNIYSTIKKLVNRKEKTLSISDKFIILNEVGIMQSTKDMLPSVPYTYGNKIVKCPKCGNCNTQIMDNTSLIYKPMYLCLNCKYKGY